MVAPFRPLNKYLAARTPFPISEIVLKINIARSTLVLGQLALLTKLHPASRAPPFPTCHVYQPLASIGRTQLQLGVIHSLFPQFIPSVPIFALLRQQMKHLSLIIKHRGASFLRTADLRHDVDLVNAVGVETGQAENVGALGDGGHLLAGEGLLAEGAFGAG